jgi:hypothetical protein
VPAQETGWSVTFRTSKSFEAQIVEAIEHRGREISKALGKAFVYLYEYPWDEPRGRDFYSVYKDSYIYRIHRDYLLAFDLKVDRRSSGRPEKVVLRLKAIQMA